jgi:diguanylate cyclase (GGDEF)-like protein
MSSGIDTSSLRAKAASHELTSLDERLGLLLLVRVGLVALILLAGVFASKQVAFDVAQVGPICAAYLVVAAAAEWYRRSQWRGRMLVHRAVLPLDAVFLAIVTTPSGGPRSPLVILFAVQLIAVTILGSERAGLRIALWDTFLFVMIPTLSLSARIGELLGVKRVAAPPASQTALAIMGFWAVAICTAVFSMVSEKELRRSKQQITALATMASEMEGTDEEDQILAILLRTLVRSFGFKRGALWCAQASRPVGLALPAPDAMVASVPVPPLARADRVAGVAWADRDPQLVRRLSAEDDPVAAGLLPGATNVVILPLQIEGNDLGIVLLEHGGHPLNARIQKRTLLLLGQFAGHAALVLRNARLLAERERLAAIDGLTGLANRREFDQVLAGEVNRSERSLEPLSLVVFDVDHFKTINDTRGHLGGDEVLRAIAEVLAGAVREMDLVARYGGEEFALVLPRCDQEDAVRVIERITSSSRARADLEGITLSAGVATLPLNANDAISLVSAADEALYESKRAGRNRYSVSGRREEQIGPLGMYTG